MEMCPGLIPRRAEGERRFTVARAWVILVARAPLAVDELLPDDCSYPRIESITFRFHIMAEQFVRMLVC